MHGADNPWQVRRAGPVVGVPCLVDVLEVQQIPPGDVLMPEQQRGYGSYVLVDHRFAFLTDRAGMIERKALDENAARTSTEDDGEL